MGISITEMLLLLLIVIVLFGTSRLRNLGTDLGAAIKGFRTSIRSHDPNNLADERTPPVAGQSGADKDQT